MATAIPKAYLASSAIRCRDVETGPNLGVLAVLPSNGTSKVRRRIVDHHVTWDKSPKPVVSKNTNVRIWPGCNDLRPIVFVVEWAYERISSMAIAPRVLGRLIFFGENSLRRAVNDFVAY